MRGRQHIAGRGAQPQRLSAGSEGQLAELQRAITEKEEAVRAAGNALAEAKNEVSTLRASMKAKLVEVTTLLSPYPEQSDCLQAVLDLALPKLQGLAKRTRGDYTTLREVQVPGKSQVAFRATIDGHEVFLKRFDVGDEGLRHELRSRESLPPHQAILQPTGYMPETEEGTESVRRRAKARMRRHVFTSRTTALPWMINCSREPEPNRVR